MHVLLHPNYTLLDIISHNKFGAEKSEIVLHLRSRNAYCPPLKDGEVMSGGTDPPLLANDKGYVGQIKMAIGKVKNYSPVQRPNHNWFFQIFYSH